MQRARTLAAYWGKDTRDPLRKNDIVIAKPSDIPREAKFWREFNDFGLRRIGGSSGQNWVEVPDQGVAAVDGSPLANSTVELSILPSAAQWYAPNNFFQKGVSLRWWAAGRVSTTGTPTLRLKLNYSATVNTNVLADTTALTTGSGLSNNTWWWRGHLTCRADGSTANVMAISELVGITGAATQVQVPASAPAVSSNFDATASNPIFLTALWGTASASNTITLHMFILELLN